MDFLLDHVAAAWNVAEIEAIEEPGHQEPADQDEGERSRHAEHHPVEKTDFDTQFRAGIAGDDRVGRAAEQRSQAAHAGRPRDRQHQADRETTNVGIFPQIHVPGPGQGGGVVRRVRRRIRAVAHERDDRQADRQHHERCGGVGNPHGKKAGGEHEAKHDLLGRRADPAQCPQCNPPMQIPFFHRDGDEEATQKQKDDRAGIGGSAACHIQIGNHRHQHDRKKRGGGKRDRFGSPPYSHQCPNCGNGTGILAQILSAAEREPDRQRGNRPQGAKHPGQPSGAQARRGRCVIIFVPALVANFIRHAFSQSHARHIDPIPQDRRCRAVGLIRHIATRH